VSISAAAVIPSAPVLLPGASPSLPPEFAETVTQVTAAVGGLIASLDGSEALVLLAGAPDAESAGVYLTPQADLGGLSRPDLSTALTTATQASELAAELGLAVRTQDLPVDVAVLALQAAHAGWSGPVLPIAVPWDDGAALVQFGSMLARYDVAVLAAGDLAAGLSTKAPRHEVTGAAEWDAAATAAVGAGDVAGLEALGPAEARRVGARAWPALVVLLGALKAGGLGLSVAYDAPRGVGYVVGST